MSFEDKNFRRIVSADIFLGRGSFGDVYGPCDWDGKKCAIKQRWLNKATKEDIEKELVACQTWMSLHHKSLIAVYDISLEPHAVYIMMEYASGGSLHAELSRYKSDLPFEIQMDWTIQIADGMAHLHKNNIVHRDLKSPNIVIMEEGALSNSCEKTLKITDFDQIREHDGTKTMTKAGTYAWTAPEFLKDDKFSKASDVWSYGVVLWEIMTRNVPYNGVPEQLIFVEAEAGLLKSTIPSSCSHIMKYFLERCLSIEKEQRPSFEEILQHLKGYLSGVGEDPQRYDFQEKGENRLHLHASDGSRPKTLSAYEKKLVFLKNRTFLEERMDSDFGLLDKLRANGTIDFRETQDIKMEGTTCKRNSKLLNYILAKDRIDGLLAALEATDQTHFANYLRANAEYSDEFGEEWPLTEKEISILDSNHECLIDYLDVSELLIFLFSLNVINTRQKDSISSKPTPHEKNEALLEILRRRSLRHYQQTIICLRQSHQSHIADLLKEGGVGSQYAENLAVDESDVTSLEAINNCDVILENKGYVGR